MCDRIGGDKALGTLCHRLDYCPFCGHALADRQRAALRIKLTAAVPGRICAALGRTRLLSPREMDVFELLGRGYNNRSLAQRLAVSERTTKRHVTAILAKLGLESRLQAGLAALVTAALPQGNGADPKVASTCQAPTGDTELYPLFQVQSPMRRLNYSSKESSDGI